MESAASGEKGSEKSLSGHADAMDGALETAEATAIAEAPEPAEAIEAAEASEPADVLTAAERSQVEAALLAGEPSDSRHDPSRRRPLIAAALSFIWPGLGELTLGRPRAAAFFAVPAALFAILVLYEIGTDPVLVATSLWDQTYVVAVILAITIFGAWRIASVLHAFGRFDFRRRWRSFESAVAIGLVAAIVGMHGLAASGAWIWYQLSVDVQNNDFFAVSSPTPALSPTATAKPTPTPPGYQATAAPVWAVNPMPASSPSKPPNPNRITFLLVGIDFMAGRTHALTDTLMVVSVDTQTRKVSIISVPRDTAGFQMYYGPWVGSIFKLNSVLSYVDNGKLKSPDDPMTTLEKEISFLIGVPINYYAAVDMDGFAKMVDAIGGVDVYNPRNINDPDTGIIMTKGPHHLDGATAVLYARSRENGGSDYIRADRQQGLLVALERKVLSASAVPKLNTLLNLASRSIATDFPLKTAKNYVKIGQTLTSIENCVLSPPYSWHPDSSTTRGTWTSRLDLNQVAGLSVAYFGQDSLYYGQPGVKATPCLT